MKKLLVICFLLASVSCFSQEIMRQDSSVTAIENEIAAIVKVYPNPFSNDLKIECPANVQYTAIDHTGRAIDLNSTTAGVYFIVFSGRREKYIQKVIKY